MKYRVEMTIEVPEDWGPGETLEKVSSAMLVGYPAKLRHILVMTEQRAIDEGRQWLHEIWEESRS